MWSGWRCAEVARLRNSLDCSFTSDHIEFTSDDIEFHVDARKGFNRHFLPEFPRPLFSKAGAWQVDRVAERAPWRAAIPSDEKITFSRLAVHRAWQLAIAGLGRKRGEVEASCVLRRCYPDLGDDPLRELRSAAGRPDEPLSPLAFGGWLLADLHARRLGLPPPPAISNDGSCANLAAWLDTIGNEARIGRGRPSTFDLNAFFE